MTDAASLVGLAMMVAGLVGLILRQQVLSAAPAVIVLQACAVALMVWARLTFGGRSFHATASPTPGGLVTAGPYRWLRHPIYTAVCLFIWACFVGHPSWFARISMCATPGRSPRAIPPTRCSPASGCRTSNESGWRIPRTGDRWLKPGGRYALIDSLPDAASGAADHPAPVDDRSVRRLDDGREFEIVKVYYRPEELAMALEAAGFRDVEVTTTGRFFVLATAVR